MGVDTPTVVVLPGSPWPGRVLRMSLCKPPHRPCADEIHSPPLLPILTREFDVAPHTTAAPSALSETLLAILATECKNWFCLPVRNGKQSGNRSQGANTQGTHLTAGAPLSTEPKQSLLAEKMLCFEIAQPSGPKTALAAPLVQLGRCRDSLSQSPRAARRWPRYLCVWVSRGCHGWDRW